MEQFMNEDNTFHNQNGDEEDQEPGDPDFKMRAFNDESIYDKKRLQEKIEKKWI